jgi:exopolysaccharide biosynthesis polyprenyl glycosylphosphotransferase
VAVADLTVPLRGLRTDLPAQPRARRGVLHLPRLVLRSGMLGYVATGAAAVLLADRFALPVVWRTGVLSLVGAWLVYSFAAMPAYERARSLKPARRLVITVGAATPVAVLLGVQNTLTLQHAMAVVLTAALVLSVSALLNRVLLRRSPTILVGQVESVRRLSDRWTTRRDVNVVATCTWRAPHELAPVGSVSEDGIAEVVREVLAAVSANRASSVVIASGRALATPALRHLAWALQRAEVECLVVADMSDHVEFLRPRRVGDQIALALRAPNDHLMSLAAKSLLDRVTAAVALLLLSPLLLLIGLAVRIGSRGPAIFAQERTGKDGVPFTMYKFRTMVVDAELRLEALRRLNEGAGPLFKLANDPRVTRIGRFLRRTSLDELPQLLNVLKGDMSLVGPRPALEAETSQYSQWVWRRLHVKPGMTGLWQVSGRSALSWEESIRMDLQYVNNWNLRLDLAILARTLHAVLARDGAL